MNIRDLIDKLEFITTLCGEDQEVHTFDPDMGEWYGVTNIVYGGGDNIVQIYNDED